jgi:hypothetical protein
MQTLDEWVEMTLASIDEQLAELAAKDEAAFKLFRAKLTDSVSGELDGI